MYGGLYLITTSFNTQTIAYYKVTACELFPQKYQWNVETSNDGNDKTQGNLIHFKLFFCMTARPYLNRYVYDSLQRLFVNRLQTTMLTPYNTYILTLKTLKLKLYTFLLCFCGVC